MTAPDWNSLSERLIKALRPVAAPLAITFSPELPEDVPAFDEPLAEPTDDGRTGRVPAGCVFWIKAGERTFSTVAEDHGNCSVGSLTHGLKTLEEAAQGADVATLLESGWLAEEVFPHIPVVPEKPGAITYGPLAETPIEPDVVLLRINPYAAMVLSDALDDIKVEGKPQCHIVAMAKEGQIACSIGCALSRARTGMQATEMTCAIPARRLAEVLDKVECTSQIDMMVARYAGEDARRFQFGVRGAN
jgi:uncharacterized protein (DUF169 family)